MKLLPFALLFSSSSIIEKKTYKLVILEFSNSEFHFFNNKNINFYSNYLFFFSVVNVAPSLHWWKCLKGKSTLPLHTRAHTRTHNISGMIDIKVYKFTSWFLE